MELNDFMLSLNEKLREKVRDSSANLYLHHLYTMNNKSPFKNLGFLKHYKTIDTLMKPYSDNTKKSILTAITSTLELFKDKPTYSKAYNHYLSLLTEAGKAEDAKPKNVMNEKQRNAWVKWEDIEEKKKSLREEIESYKTQKSLTPGQFEKLLQYLLLSIYTDQPPRRNLDYQEMVIVSKENPMTDTTKNYFVWDDPKFIFNRYKTQSKHGKQEIDLKDNSVLQDVLNLYLHFHPAFKGKTKSKTFSIPFLVKYDGTKLPSDNSITRILNRIFKKPVGSSMLRHIYLTHKYGDKLTEMSEDSEKMAHTPDMQREYILKEGSGSSVVESTPPPADDSPIKELLASIVSSG